MVQFGIESFSMLEINRLASSVDLFINFDIKHFLNA